jgi:hypothetical protein
VNAIVRNTKKAEELKKLGAVNLFEVEDLIAVRKNFLLSSAKKQQY